MLDDVYKKNKEKEIPEVVTPSTGWRSSSLGSCLRGQFLGRLLSGTFKVQHDRRTESVFELGNIIEDLVMDKFLQQDEWIVVQQGEMYSDLHNLKGHFDALFINKKTGEAVMFECKSKNSTAFTYMDKKKEGAMAHHKLQIHSYMYMVNNFGFTLPPIKKPAFYKGAETSVPLTEVEQIQESKYLLELHNRENLHIELSRVCYVSNRGGINYYTPKQKINYGYILYVSKDDQRLLEFVVPANDDAIRQEWQDEVALLNYAWEHQEILPENPKGAWQSKYCTYCNEGMCSKLGEKKVVEDLFTIVNENKNIQNNITKSI